MYQTPKIKFPKNQITIIFIFFSFHSINKQFGTERSILEIFSFVIREQGKCQKMAFLPKIPANAIAICEVMKPVIISNNEISL